MKKSKITKDYQTGAIVLQVLSIMCTVVPLLVFSIIAFIKGEPQEKAVMGATLTTALIMGAVSLIFKHHIRSTIWIAALGIYACLRDIQDMLITMAVCTIADEFIFTPLAKHFKSKYSINKEIDRRQ